MTQDDSEPISVLLVEDDPPVDFNRFIEVVRQTDEFLVSVVKLPAHRPPPA